MDCSTPGLPAHHQLPEHAQTHVHWVSDAIQPSHPLSPPSPSAFTFPSISVFSSKSVLHIRWPKVLEFQLQHQSFQWIFRTDFLEDWLVWFPCSPRDSQESSPTPQIKSINSLALTLLYAPSFLLSLTTLFSYPLTTFKLFKKSCLYSLFQFPIQSNYLGNCYNVCTPTIE